MIAARWGGAGPAIGLGPSAAGDDAEPGDAAPRQSRTRFTLRRRLMLGASLAVALGIAAVTAFAYVTTRHNLTAGVDEQLGRLAAQQQVWVNRQIAHRPAARLVPLSPGELDGYLQYTRPSGPPVTAPDDVPVLPVSDTTRQVATGAHDDYTVELTVQGTPVRMLTTRLADGLAAQIAVPITQEQSELTDFGVVLGLAGLVGIALAMALGWVVARTTLKPVAKLTETAERIAATHDLAYRMEETRSDELGRLATSFNAMLDAVQRATSAQRQLVADASHELRTPLTSLRTNAEVLASTEELPPDERARIQAKLVKGLAEMSGLISDLMELARGEEAVDLVEPVDFRALVAEAVDRAREHWPATVFDTDLEPVEVLGAPERLQRAASNLLDNAAKFSPVGSTVEVRLDGHGTLTIRDHGPGIPTESLPHVFDRFYRARGARGKPGSGLGLAIVRQVADFHRGSVAASAAEGGGTLVHFAISPTRASAAIREPAARG